jgi:hypothetical protein
MLNPVYLSKQSNPHRVVLNARYTLSLKWCWSDWVAVSGCLLKAKMHIFRHFLRWPPQIYTSTEEEREKEKEREIVCVGVWERVWERVCERGERGEREGEREKIKKRREKITYLRADMGWSPPSSPANCCLWARARASRKRNAATKHDCTIRKQVWEVTKKYKATK